MKIDDVMKLIDAGFSKDEIVTYFGEAAPAPAPEAPKDPEPAPEAVNDPAPTPDAMKEALDGFLDSLKAVVNDIKAANIGSSAQPEQHHDSAEEVLASIIAPPAKKK